MPTGDGSLTAILGILAVLILVAANGFFVAAEFSLVAVRRSRVAQLVASGERKGPAEGDNASGREPRGDPAWHHHFIAGARPDRRTGSGALGTVSPAHP